MRLVVGDNCYFDVAEADEIMQSRFISTNKLRKLWDSLTDSDKEVIILSTTEKYDSDSFEYSGVKKDVEQSLQFPRLDFGNIVECPNKIKTGLLVQGLTDLSEADSEEITLRESGVKSFSDGSGAKIEFDNDHSKKNKLNICNNVWSLYFSDYSDIGKIKTI